ncbi:indolepyruvate ferredoxin oxidoreductase family protein [Mycobacterium sp. GA-2829]|uniref:indolepyruvate ferredoxin oxidoreductase family protein n=1 Tax=Mycobacterium sp. GA-2829 TaxID=1772283 RepID=UPI0007403F24|nr:indolepyruvate ferredoxin oxidoreductase family protein [Mycobacterium sp. GA-2829]KUI26519.1 2-oxoacid ferredoxin oxidoreductase [Mycobacterium sp. GA-2829]
MTVLSDRYELQTGFVHLTGIQALARLPLDIRRADRRAGRRTAGFISGYEGSPLAGYDTELIRIGQQLAEADVVFRPGVNEELAATAVQGTQIASAQDDKRVDGVFGVWYGKSPGLDRASDAVRHANLMGTHPEGGVLALVGDDPAAKSSTVPGTSEGLLADLRLPVLYPADSQDILDFGLHGIALSRACGLWVAMKIATNVADGSGTVTLDPDRVQPSMPHHDGSAAPYRHRIVTTMLQPHLTDMERSQAGVRLQLARDYARANRLDRIVTSSPCNTVGIVSAGKTFRDLQQAMSTLGVDPGSVRLLKLGMVFPLEPTTIREFARGLDEIIVVEEKRSFIEAQIKDVLYGSESAPRISGKHTPEGDSLIPADGELDPDVIADRLAQRLSLTTEFAAVRSWVEARDNRAGRGRITLPLISRTPYFCSGCPHNISTKVPDGATVGAGIGCHGLAATMQPQQVGDVVGMAQMGGEGALWIGMAPFIERTHLFQNIGDGTFHHSGSLAVRAAVAAGIDITYKLLYNSAVAMTGGQQAVGLMSVPSICQELVAEGVARILITTDDVKRYRRVKLPRGVQVWSRDRIVEAQESLAATPGVTVLIHDQECATELRRKRKRGRAPEPAQRVIINERVCEGCGDCGQKSNCLSVVPVDTEFGRKTRIDQSSCNRDYSCLAGDCPSFVTVTATTPSAPGRPRETLEDLPEPDRPPLATTHTIRITGVGGTGVVTLAQMLSTAAALTGLNVRTLDQTGLAQKGGAVVSDVKISAEPLDVANKAAAGECDLYLGCDVLVAAEPRNLAAANPDHTVAVLSTTEVATGRMVVDPSVSFPDTGPILDAVAQRVQRLETVDARTVSTALFGSDLFANLFLVGAAYQCGAVPIPASALEDAIAANGVAVDKNRSAFRYGRLMIADPEAFAAALLSAAPARVDRRLSALAEPLFAEVRATPGGELDRLMRVRIPELIAYQDVAYARRYVRWVELVRQRESARTPDRTALTDAVAVHLHKLMAYKDEYEVARLSLDPRFHDEVTAQFGPDAKIAYRLHPPALRALGMKNKIELGAGFRAAFRVLRPMRRLRGTVLDPFGAAEVRRVERRLIDEYRATVDELLDGLDAGNHELAVRIAELPDVIRGYESIKLANVERYRDQLERLLTEYRASVA